jgi:hypothetical protein
VIYSVHSSGSYRYFEGPGEFPPTGQFRTPRGKPINGLFPPNQYLPLLPSGVTEVGQGAEARGILAVFPEGVLEGLPDAVKTWAPPVMVGLFAGWLSRRFWK